MKFNIKALSLTCGIFCSGLFILCAVFVWLTPNFVLQIFDLLSHGISLKPIYAPAVSFSDFVTGLILTFVFSVIGAAVFGWLYNKFSKT